MIVNYTIYVLLVAPGALPNYDSRRFPSFAVTVDVAVFTIRDEALQLLLVKRAEDPFKEALALPGGFVKPDEDLDQAAARELAEETGLRDGSWHLDQLGSYGAPDRDPRMRVVTVSYWGICADLPAPRAGGEVAAAVLVPVREIELCNVRLAFDHERIVRDAVDRTRSKLEYTALAAKFCPPEFTIAELRRVYEAVWNTRLDPGNFQRNVQASGAFEKRGMLEASFRSRRGRRAALWSVRGPVPGDDRLAAPLHRGLARRRHPAVPSDDASESHGGSPPTKDKQTQQAELVWRRSLRSAGSSGCAG